MQEIAAQFGAKPQFIVAGTSRYDVHQGNLGRFIWQTHGRTDTARQHLYRASTCASRGKSDGIGWTLSD